MKTSTHANNAICWFELHDHCMYMYVNILVIHIGKEEERGVTLTGGVAVALTTKEAFLI